MGKRDEEKAGTHGEASKALAVVELASELGIRKQTVFKIANRLGIQQVKRRDPERGNQQIAVISEASAEAIRDEYNRTRRVIDSGDDDTSQFAPDIGWFYVIELEPEHDPGRFKVGFTNDVDDRLRKHRCSAPFAIYRKQWPCKRLWERTAMDCLTAGAVQLHTEVFRTDSLEHIVEIGDRFFALMPSVEPIAAPESDDVVSIDGYTG